MMTITIPSPRAARSYGIEANPLKACNFLLIIAFFSQDKTSRGVDSSIVSNLSVGRLQAEPELGGLNVQLFVHLSYPTLSVYGPASTIFKRRTQNNDFSQSMPSRKLPNHTYNTPSIGCLPKSQVKSRDRTYIHIHM